ncbi:hypothetical protein ACFL49_02400, partial [Candidatus Omnitrophota bacterium]
QTNSCGSVTCPSLPTCDAGVCGVQTNTCGSTTCPSLPTCDTGVCGVQSNTCGSVTCPILPTCDTGVCGVQSNTCGSVTCPSLPTCGGVCGLQTNTCGTTNCGECCTDTCPTLGYQCGTQSVCGESINCGTCATSSYSGNNYCSGGDVYRDYVTRGCASGSCTESTEAQLQDDCEDDEICEDGECVSSLTWRKNYRTSWGWACGGNFSFSCSWSLGPPCNPINPEGTGCSDIGATCQSSASAVNTGGCIWECQRFTYKCSAPCNPARNGQIASSFNLASYNIYFDSDECCNGSYCSEWGGNQWFYYCAQTSCL